MGEFELIQHYFKKAACAAKVDGVELGIGDDCALLSLSPRHEFAISTDTLVSDIHFPSNGDPFLIGQRALAVAASDLAAMGAAPLAFTLALTLPHVDECWLGSFAKGLSEKAIQCHLTLIGGDTTKGSLSMTVTVLGEVPQGQALYRSGAKVGDVLCVSGCLGDAAGALPMVLGKTLADPKLLQHYWSPCPQLELGIFLRGKATACLDISDGLLGDCQHIAKASHKQLIIEASKLPCSEALVCHYDKATCQQLMLTGGDDYHLAFTLPLHYVSTLQDSFPQTQVIGRVVEGDGVLVVDADNHPLSFEYKSYQHF